MIGIPRPFVGLLYISYRPWGLRPTNGPEPHSQTSVLGIHGRHRSIEDTAYARCTIPIFLSASVHTQMDPDRNSTDRGYPVFRSGSSSNSGSHIYWPRQKLVEDSAWLFNALQLLPKQLLDGLMAVMDATPHSVTAVFPSTWPSTAQSFVYQEETNRVKGLAALLGLSLAAGRSISIFLLPSRRTNPLSSTRSGGELANSSGSMTCMKLDPGNASPAGNT